MTEKTQFFLNELKAKYIINDDYDYSLVDYKTIRDRVKIKYKPSDTIHLVRPIVLRKGYGCIMENTIDKNKFALYQYMKVHGNKFEYPNFNYENAKALINVKCQTHGIFKISHNKHTQGRGCPKCGLERRGEKRKLSTEAVLKSFKEIHGNKFDYSLFEYKTSTTKVKIICKKHGVFEQTPDKHKNGSGCPKCRGFGLSNEERILNLIKANGNKYDYSLLKYKNKDTKVKIICEKHGVFTQTYNNHLKGRGCPVCYGIKTYDTKTIVEEFKKVHGNTYDYSQVKYKNTHSKIKTWYF